MPRGDDETLEETLLHDALSVFDRLEAMLRQGGATPIESWLAKSTITDRSHALSLLVALELAARRGRGERPLESEYLQRFPDHVSIIRAAFRRSSSEGGTTRFSEDPGLTRGAPRLPTSSSRDEGPRPPRTLVDPDVDDGATLSHFPDSSTEPGDRPVGGGARYSLSRFHKGGGLGEVWRARDHQLGREVALKRLKEENVTQSEVRARFLREAWITGQLQHPGIVPVFELGTLPDRDGPFYTMRFMEGPTLSAAVADFHGKRKEGTTGPLDQRKLLSSFVVACQVVAYAHSRGVIHRDLKGQNIVLGDFGEVIVLDWGLAKVVGDAPAEPGDESVVTPTMVVGPPDGVDGETIDGSVMGTPAYMAPEQALGRIDEIDERCDVYGMGAILYEILTGEPPFRGTRDSVLRKVVTEPPIRPRQMVPEAPEALEAICLKCLAKSPGDRYPSAVALADDVQRFLGGEPVSVHRESWTIRARRRASRHRTLVAATLATSLVATVCLGVATALLRIANGREATARSQTEKHLSLTLHAVDSFFTRVAEAPSLKTFGLERFRKEVLTEAEKVIKQLRDVQSGAAEVSAEKARCGLRLGLISVMLGDPESAIPSATEARSIFATLAEDDPERSAEHRHGLAESLDALGLAYEGVFRLDEANAAYEQAADVWLTLETDPRSTPEVSYRLAASLNRRGRLLCLKLGDPRGARGVLALSRQRCDQLVREHPTSADYVRERARAMMLVGVAFCFGDIQDIDGAITLFEEAILHFERQAQGQPGNTEVQADLVDACAVIASSYSNARLEGRIRMILDRVRSNAGRLVREHPDVPIFAENLALIEAMHAMRIALAGDHRLAVGLLDDALKGAGDSGLARLFAACCYSVASEKVPESAGADREILVERYRVRAVELLREAKETGLFFQPQQREGVRSKDDDLKPLRNRADFRTLLVEIDEEVDRGQISRARSPRPGRP